MDDEFPLCRFCSGNDLKVWVDQYYRCNDCLFVSAVPAPTTEELDQHYCGYHEKNHQASALKNDQRALSYAQEISWLADKLDFSGIGQIYDYGASGGYFLDAFRNALAPSTELYGFDASPGAVEQLRDKGYYKELINLQEGEAGLVTLRGVLEHLLDFRGIVHDLCRGVRSGGYLFITATPDSSSTVANRYRREWTQHHYPSHFQHFNTNLVDILMGENGLVPHGTIDLYESSVYRNDTDNAHWLSHCQGTMEGINHAYWGSMMTRLYRKT